MNHPNPMLTRYMMPDMPTSDDILPYLRQIDQHRWYSNFGPLVSHFERRLTETVLAGDAPVFATSAASCYHALQIGLQLFNLQRDARVLIPAVTFPACPHAVRHAGAEPVLADIDAETWQLTPDIAQRALAKMPIHAVMPVAIYGIPVPVEAWDQFSEKTGIPVIIDAAAALGAQTAPRHALVAYSLHATKPFGIGEGGVLAAPDQARIDQARCISNFGTFMRITQRDGVNGKISEYHGAVALAQLDRWEGIKERRKATFAQYRKAIETIGLPVTFQQGIEEAIVSTLMLRTETIDAGNVVDALNAQGIAGHRMYLPPLYHHPYFAGLTVVNSEGSAIPATTSLEEKAAFMANSEDLYRSVFGVPFHAFLQEADIDQCIKAVSEIVGTKSAFKPS